MKEIFDSTRERWPKAAQFGKGNKKQEREEENGRRKIRQESWHFLKENARSLMRLNRITSEERIKAY